MRQSRAKLPQRDFVPTAIKVDFPRGTVRNSTANAENRGPWRRLVYGSGYYTLPTAGPLRVKSAVLTLRRLLSVYPNERTTPPVAIRSLPVRYF